jgi:hypothetical protein
VGSAIRLARRRRQWVRGRIDGLSVRIADDVGPAVLGVLRNEIVVPRWLLSHSASDRQLILEHERQHVLARDPLVLFSALLLASLLPWNPGVWLLVRGLRRSTEIDCDRRVLRTCGRPGRYASLLIEIGSRARSPMLARMGLVGRESDLERRVSAILGLSQGTSRRPTGSRLVLSGALLATPLLAPHPVVRLPSFAAGHALDGATDRPLPEGAGVASGSSLLAARAGSLRRSVLAGGTNTRVARGGAGMSWTGPSGESHVIDSDTLAHLMAQHYPGLVNELAHPDSIVVVFAFDDEARLMHTTVAPAPPDGRDVRAVLHRLFPDLAGRRWRGGGWISRLVTSAPGARPRRVATVFGVFEADP